MENNELQETVGYDLRMSIRTSRFSVRFVVGLTLAAIVACSSRPETPTAGDRAHAEPSQEESVVSRTSAIGPFVRVLGTAQDGGFPHAACTGKACLAAREPGHERLIASLAIVLPQADKVYLLDATPDIRAQLDRLADVRGPLPDGVDRAPVDGVFLTHGHVGHYLGLAFFGYESIHARSLDLWATPRMSEFLESNGPWSQLVTKQNVAIHEIAPGRVVELEDGVTVEFVNSPHRDEYTDTVGFLIRGPTRSVLFVPDTDSWDRWSPPIEHWIEQTDVALLDGSFYSRDELPDRKISEIGHPLITQSVTRFRPLIAAGKQIQFIHLNHSNPLLRPESPELAELETRGFSVTSDGEEFEL